MPTLGALFIAFAVIQFARGYQHLYSAWAYGGLMCLMVSGLLRMFEKFTGQLGWNNPDLYWNSLLTSWIGSRMSFCPSTPECTWPWGH